MALCDRHCRVLLVAGLMSCSLLVGCVSSSDLFKKFYKSAASRESVPAVNAQPRASSPPQLVYSHDPGVDGKRLRDVGYVLIGSSSFNGAPDLSFADRAAIAQGQNVGAAIVLLRIRSYSTVTSCCWLDGSLEGSARGATSYFASYWSRPEAAKLSGSQ